MRRNPFEIRSQFHPMLDLIVERREESRNPFEIRSQFHLLVFREVLPVTSS